MPKLSEYVAMRRVGVVYQPRSGQGNHRTLNHPAKRPQRHVVRTELFNSERKLVLEVVSNHAIPARAAKA